METQSGPGQIRVPHITSDDFTGVLLGRGIEISMDGKGSWPDNVFVERLWRSLKYEEVYLVAYKSVASAKARIGEWIGFYNERRPHQGLDMKTVARQSR